VRRRSSTWVTITLLHEKGKDVIRRFGFVLDNDTRLFSNDAVTQARPQRPMHPAACVRCMSNPRVVS
jgi:hypothetical protein